MAKGMRLFVSIAHVYLDRIVLVLVFMCMNMNVLSCVVLMCYVKGFINIGLHTHMNYDLVNNGTLKVYP